MAKINTYSVSRGDALGPIVFTVQAYTLRNAAERAAKKVNAKVDTEDEAFVRGKYAFVTVRKNSGKSGRLLIEKV